MPSRLKQKLASIFAVYPSFDFLDEEQSFISDLMKEAPMILQGVGEVHYERSGGLLASYQESGHSPLFVISKNRKVLGVISESRAIKKGILTEIYYSSDLRIQPQADRTIRLNFRSLFADIVRICDGQLYTCILDRNIAAINSLTRKQAYSYNPFIRYSSYSLLVNPFMRLFKPCDFKIEPISSEEALTSVQRFSVGSDFTQFDPSHQAYALKCGAEVVAVFSVKRPVYRKTVVRTTNTYARLCLTVASWIFRRPYSQYLPWVYVTSIALKDQNILPAVVRAICSLGLKNGVFKTGELLQFLGPRGLSIPFGFGPKMVVDATMYAVTAEKKDIAEAKVFSLSPMAL